MQFKISTLQIINYSVNYKCPLRERGNMQLNKFKYYAVLLTLLVMIVCTIVFSNSNMIIENTDISTELDTEQDAENEEEKVEVNQSLPEFRSWNKLWDYSYAILEKGYTSTISMQVEAKTVGITSTQLMYATQSYNKNTKQMHRGEFFYNSTGIVGDSGNYYENFYQEDTTLYTRKTQNLDFDKKNYVFTDEEEKTTIRDMHPDVYTLKNNSLVLNKDNVNCLLFDRVSDSKYFIIKLEYKASALSDAYKNTFLNSGFSKSVNVNSVSFEIKISKATAHLKYIKLKEVYSTEVSFLPMTADCVGETVQVFTMNENAQISKGY